MLRRVFWAAVACGLACGRREAPAAERTASAGVRPAERIVSQTVMSDEILWTLGPEVRARVVGISRMADDPRYSPVAGTWPEEVPRVGSTAESLLAVGPDLVIVAGFTSIETRSLLEQARVETVMLEAFDGFDDYRETVRLIADSVGASAEGERLVREFDTRVGELEARRTLEPAPIISWNDGSVAGRKTTFDEAALTAGFSNLAAENGIDGHTRISFETLVAWDPPYIVIPCGEVSCDQAERQFAARPGVGAMRAIEDGHVIGVESAILYSAGSSMLDLAATLARRKKGARP